MQYPFVKPSMPDLKKILPNLEKIWENNWYSNNGPFVKELEKEIASFYGISSERVVTCANATIGLTLIIKTLNWEKKVLTPYFTFPATIQAIHWNNLSYSYLDINRVTHHAILERKHYSKERNLLLMFPYGCPKKYSNLKEFKSVIVDAAASFGNKSDSMLWTIENVDALVFSLHATKVLGIGEGGFVIFRDKQKAEKFRRLINFGFSKQRDIVLGGTNGKMCEILASIGIEKIKNMNSILEGISSNIDLFKIYLKNYKSPIHKEKYKKHPWQFIPVVLDVSEKDRDKTMVIMRERYGIQTGKYYEPLKYESLDKSISFSNTLEINSKIISLPIYHSMCDADIEYITTSLRKTLESLRGDV